MTLLDSRPRLLSSLLAGLLAAGCLSGCASKPPPPDETAAPAPVGVEPKKELIFGEWTEILGATQPLPGRSARVTAPIEGHVVWLLHDPAAKGQALVEGQRVEKGQVIGQLDDRIARATRAKAKAAEDDLKQTQQQAELAVQVARLDVQSKEKLVSNGTNPSRLQAISEIEVEKARIALKDAESKLKGVAAKQEAGKAELEALDEQIELFKLRAPIAGRLGTIQAVPGQTLTPGAMVAEVIDLDEIDVLCFVPPQITARLALNQETRIATEKGEEKGPRGKVVYIAEQAQPDTGSFAVKVRFPNREVGLRSGSVVRIEVLTKPEQPRITVADAALMEDQNPPAVVVVPEFKTVKNAETGKDEQVGQARVLRVTLGVRNRAWQRAEILSLFDPKTKEQIPLTEDLQFVVKGAYGLETKDWVKLEQEEEE
jgi:RND family efflux transporter MFP subunit